MRTSLIIRGAQAVTIGLDPAAESERDALVAGSSLLMSVESDQDLEEAVGHARGLKAIAKATEEARTNVKAPVLDIGRAIDAKAKEFVAPVAAELQRVEKLMADYTRRREEERRAAERRRQEEIRRAQEEEARKLREIEEQARRKRQEEEQAAREAAELLGGTEAEVTKAVAEVAAEVNAQAEAAAAAVIQDTERQTNLAIVETAPAVSGGRPDGLSMRRVPAFRISCGVILAQSNPELVAIEPKTREIQAMLRESGEFEGEREVRPGLIAWWETKVGVR